MFPLPLRLRIDDPTLSDAIQLTQRHFIRTANVDHDGERQWLRDVLSKRDEGLLFERDAIERMIDASGGIVRHLVAIAKTATQIAFHSKADTITLDHALRAIAQFTSAVLVQQLSWRTFQRCASTLACQTQQRSASAGGTTSPWVASSPDEQRARTTASIARNTARAGSSMNGTNLSCVGPRRATQPASSIDAARGR